jgi:agmatinase
MDFSMLGIKYDRTQSFRKGAARAPDLIRTMLPKTENFVNDVDLGDKAFIKDLGDIVPLERNNLINDTFIKLSREKTFPIILGGEHTVSYAVAKAIKPQVFVSFDAHPDLRDDNTHEGVTRRIGDLLGYDNIILHGVRCMSKEEHEFIQDKRIRIMSISDLKWLREPVYLSIDLDVLDPAILPAVGNPEPDGLSFNQVVEGIRALAPNLVAIDFVEYTPFINQDNDVNTTIVTKLINAAMAEIIKAKQL